MKTGISERKMWTKKKRKKKKLAEMSTKNKIDPPTHLKRGEYFKGDGIDGCINMINQWENCRGCFCEAYCMKRK